VEKDLVLVIAQGMRRELERQGFRILLTRQTDATVSFDDRAGFANAYSGGFFVSLHVASSGTPKTALAYSFGSPLGGNSTRNPARAQASGAVAWEQAQAGFMEQSQRLAGLLQVELAQKLPGSPDASQLAEVRQLRIVAHPAVAIELSSVADEDALALERLGTPLANALVRAIAAYREVRGGVKP
jgi:N-acetylmuramoyl-L-alanine amidase